MSKLSLGKVVIGSHWLSEGVIANTDGSVSKGFEMEPISTGSLEESFEGPVSDLFFGKLADLLTRLPNNFEGQFLFARRKVESAGVTGYLTRIYAFEKVAKAEGYSHISALLTELKMFHLPLRFNSWESLLGGYYGPSLLARVLPDMVWESDCDQPGVLLPHTMRPSLAQLA